MTYHDFFDRLQKIKLEFKIETGKELTTIAELEKIIDRQLVQPKKRGARSLRGIFG